MANVNRRVLPGFSLTLGYTIFYLSLLVVIPIAGVFLRSSSLTYDEFMNAVWSERARAAYALTFGASFVAALINLLLGSLIGTASAAIFWWMARDTNMREHTSAGQR